MTLLLSKFTLPLISYKSSSIILMVYSCSSPSVTNRIVSSTYYKFGMDGPSREALKLLIRPWLSVLINILLIVCVTKTKRRGDIGSPCHSLLPLWKYMETSPFIRTTNLAKRIQPLIHPIHLPSNPILLRSSNKHWQLIQS